MVLAMARPEEFDDQAFEPYDDDQERAEARAAGEHALESLRRARKNLGSASGWGLADIFGGNLVTGAMKHARIQDARDELTDAKRSLQRFVDELSDLRDVEDLDIDIDDFLTFADFFFDGAVADVIVQSRIEKAKGEVDRAISEVEDALDKLG